MYRAVCLFLLCAGALANPAEYHKCREPTQCKVSNVDVTPCATKSLSCVMNTGVNVTINFDFTPEFAATELLTDMFWSVEPSQDLYKERSLEGLERDACQSTACPVAAGVKQSFSYNLPSRKSTKAKGFYLITWKLWNKANEAQLCCFHFSISLK